MTPEAARALYTWLSVRQCAESLGMSTEFVRREIRLGRVKASKFGRDWRIKPADWQAWLVAHERQTA